ARTARAFPATQDGVAAASAYLDATLEGIDGGDLLNPVLHVILDEIASNIVRYSGASEFELTVAATADPAGVRLVFSDDGQPYDPLAHVDPDTTLSAAERPIGGLGILMVKKMSDSVDYARVRSRNVLTIFKKT
ncbi:MAG: ATP-binding protein, partial [Kiritimatiellae bacterium]|nr:ATP-binding protein [Kiritimatiellia bacterium]